MSQSRKPDAYFRFYPSDFFEAVAGYDNHVVAGYLRALSNYRNHHHCQGLPDDDDYLRRVCCVEPQFWARTKPTIFGHFFVKHDGKWHQWRMKEDYAMDCDEYEAQLKRTEAATEARRKKQVVDEPEAVETFQSGEPVKPQVDGSFAVARQAIAYFNKATGQSISPERRDELDNVRRVLLCEQPATLDQCKAAIDHCVAAWKDDAKMRNNLRLRVIFNPTTFWGYAEQGKAGTKGNHDSKVSADIAKLNAQAARRKP